VLSRDKSVGRCLLAQSLETRKVFLMDVILHNHAMQRTRDAVCRYGKSAVAGR
jgi:hypothetical protein